MIDDSNHGRSAELSQDTLNRGILGSQADDTSDGRSQASDRHTSRGTVVPHQIQYKLPIHDVCTIDTTLLSLY